MKKRKLKTFIAKLLTLAMILPQMAILPTKAANTAALLGTSNTEVISVDNALTDTWQLLDGYGQMEMVNASQTQSIHLVSGSTNDNGGKPALLGNDNLKLVSGGAIEFSVTPTSNKSDTRFGIYLNFKDTSNCIFIGCDNSSNWFYEYKINGAGSWPTLEQTGPDSGEEVKVKIEYGKNNSLVVTINGKQKVIDTAPFASLTEGEILFKAGTYKTAITDVTLKDIKFNGVATDANDWKLKSTENGESATVITNTTAGSIKLTTDDGDDNSYNNCAKLMDTTAGEFKNGSIEAVLTPNVEYGGSTTGMYLRYKDSTHFAFVGFDTSWFWEYKNGTETAYGFFDDKAGALPVVGEDVKLKLTVSDNNMLFNINDGATIDLSAEAGFNQEAFGSLLAGKMGFKAGKYDKKLDITINEVKYVKMVEQVEEETPSEAYTYSNDFETGKEDISTFANIGTGGATFTRIETGDGNHALKATVSSAGNNGAILVDTSSKKIVDGYIEADITPELGTNATKLSDIRFGMALRANTSTNGRDLVFAGSGDTDGLWFYEHWNPDNTSNSWSSMFDGPVFTPGVKAHIKAKVLGSSITLWVNDVKVFSGALGTGAQTEEGYMGFIKSRNSNNYIIDNIIITEIITPKPPTTPAIIANISSDQLSVQIDKVFPRVINYTWLKDGNAKGEVFKGQENSIYALKLNGTTVYPKVTSCTVTADKAVYVMKAIDEENNIDADITAKICVDKNTVTLELTDVKNNSNENLQTIEIPNLNMITISSKQSTAEFKGAVLSGDTSVSGDSTIQLDDSYQVGASKGYAYGVISSNKLSASIWSNSEANNDLRITRNAGTEFNELLQEHKTISLTSSPWFYEYYPVTAETQTNVSKLIPCVKVAITPDINDDNIADWQDGAIAFREIMNIPVGSEEVADLVAYRISMNFASQATNPFLKTLDNVKKVFLATDGLGQAVLMKGYGNEGHDSAHPDYGDVGDRIGGATDMNTLLNAGHEYNASFGVHINAQETYPEADAFSDDLINGNPDGWDWLDPSYTIDRNYDLKSGARNTRLGELNNVTNGNLDFIYLDVWYGGSWESRRIAEQINSYGWRMSTEFGTAVENDSTWQHWATDATYGGKASKGINSELIRFIRNHQKDSWVLNYPSYKGTADNPLLGGFNLEGFEGWGGEHDFNDYINVTFNTNLPTKFLQHYVVTNWVDVDGDKAETNLEKKITLKSDAYSVDSDVVVVTRKDNSREREITLNGTKVLDGTKYLLPWKGDALSTESSDLSEVNSEKLYHWNNNGGTSTWTLNEYWRTCQNVVLYKLSNQGRSEGTIIPVQNGTITITADPSTAYVVYKGEQADSKNVIWGEAAHVVDPGFNSNSLGTWNVTGDTASATVIKINGNETLQIKNASNEVVLTQTITGLEVGKSYVALVSVDNRSDNAATIQVNDGKKDIQSYANKSIARNYISADGHSDFTNRENNGNGSYMQTMQVSFTATSPTAMLMLKRAKGDGTTYFDDVRIVKKTVNNIVNPKVFTQDFESVVSGLYPFVLGPAQGTTDPRTHLAELHAPYTQKGWSGRVLDDVLSGNWSLKQHSINKGVIYKTIPQNFRFKAGRTYKVEFDYETVLAGGYAFAIGEGETLTDSTSIFEVSNVPKHYEKTIVGDVSNQTWIGLYGTGVSASGSIGQRDFILDNLRITDITDGEPTNESYNVQFNVVPSNAQIIVKQNGEVVAPETNGSYQLISGTYTYSISAEGYVAKENVGLNVAKDETITINLVKVVVPVPTKYNIQINVVPSNAQIIMKQNGVLVEPKSNGQYQLLPGDYTYSISAEGYVAKENIGLNVAKDETININLVKVVVPVPTKYNIQINVVPSNAQIILKQNGVVVAPKSDGQYQLLPGAYTYSISAEGYVTKENAGLNVTKDETININLVKVVPSTPSTPSTPSSSGSVNSDIKVIMDKDNDTETTLTTTQLTDSNGNKVIKVITSVKDMNTGVTKTSTVLTIEDVKSGIITTLTQANSIDVLEAVIKKDINIRNGIVVNFNHKDRFPSNAKVKINLDNQQGIVADSTVYLYYLNEKTDKLEELPNNNYVVDKDGYISVNLVRGGSFVILTNKANMKATTPLLSQVRVTTSTKTIAKGKSLALKVILPVTLEKVNSFKYATVSSEGVQAVTITYKTSNKSIAVVSKTGKIVAKGTGKVTITATMKLSDGTNKIFTTKITVR